MNGDAAVDSGILEPKTKHFCFCGRVLINYSTSMHVRSTHVIEGKYTDIRNTTHSLRDVEVRREVEVLFLLSDSIVAPAA